MPHPKAEIAQAIRLQSGKSRVTDAASGELLGVARGGVVKVAAGGSISAGAQVEVGTAGKVVTLASG